MKMKGLPHDTADIKLRLSQSVLDTLHAEELAALSKMETTVGENLAEEQRRQMGQGLQDQMVSPHDAAS